ncbi:hypothetical protein N2W54_006230 [Lotmaria passim]
MSATLSRRSCSRSLCSCVSFLSAVLFFMFLVVCGAVVADIVETPLCGEKHGFADESNDHFSIPVETAPAEGQAIILLARSFPMLFGEMMGRGLYINATFYLPEGSKVSRMSNNNGILELPRVAAGSDIEVRVHRVRKEMPVPFHFFSVFANSPVCHVAVSPDSIFIAPVPHRLSDSGKAVTMYFRTSLPPDRNAVTINIAADNRVGQPYKVLDKGGVWQSHTSNDLIESNTGNSISFSFSPTPDDTGSEYCFTAVRVSYANVQGGTVAPATAASGRGGEAQGASITTTTTKAPSSSTSMGLLRRLVLLALFCFVVWQVAQAIYNYRVLGKRDLMEIVPCAEAVAAGARGVQLAASRGLGLSHRRADGYDSVQGMNDPYT